MICPKGNKNCKICPLIPKFNPFLLYNERIRDTIRWREVITTLVLFIIFTLIFGFWVALIIIYIILKLMDKLGGLCIFIEQKPKIKNGEFCGLHGADCEFKRLRY